MDDIFVGQLMSAPVQTVTTDTPLDEAAAQMLEHNIGSVIVVDGENGLEGILTATDFVRLAADGGNATEATVAEYMTADVVTTEASEPLRDIAEMMIEHRFHHVPVVDDTEGVVGIITTTDMTAYVSHR